MSHVIDFMFFLDILITFRTTTVNIMTGQIIMEPKTIAKNYIQGRFWIDLVSTIPFEEILFMFSNITEENLKKFVIFSCLKLIRVLRLSRLIDYLNQSDDLKLQLKLVKMIFFFILYLHFSACLWFFVVDILNESYRLDYCQDISVHVCNNLHESNFWLPQQWEGYKKFTKEDREFFDLPWGHKYIFIFYNAILLLTGGDINPNNLSLMCVAITLLIFGALMNANIFGTIATIF